MSETLPARHIGRSIGAVLAGFVAVVVLSLGTDVLLRAAGIFPKLGLSMSDPLFVLATAYRTVYGIIGGYLTARLAPDRPIQHALVGGLVGLVLSVIGVVATWSKTELGPHWYPLALVVTALPCAWAGGRLRVRQLHAGLPSSR
jgi:hypothetical protein